MAGLPGARSARSVARFARRGQRKSACLPAACAGRGEAGFVALRRPLDAQGGGLMTSQSPSTPPKAKAEPREAISISHAAPEDNAFTIWLAPSLLPLATRSGPMCSGSRAATTGNASSKTRCATGPASLARGQRSSIFARLNFAARLRGTPASCAAVRKARRTPIRRPLSADRFCCKRPALWSVMRRPTSADNRNRALSNCGEGALAIGCVACSTSVNVKSKLPSDCQAKNRGRD